MSRRGRRRMKTTEGYLGAESCLKEVVKNREQSCTFSSLSLSPLWVYISPSTMWPVLQINILMAHWAASACIHQRVCGFHPTSTAAENMTLKLKVCRLSVCVCVCARDWVLNTVPLSSIYHASCYNSLCEQVTVPLHQYGLDEGRHQHTSALFQRNLMDLFSLVQVQVRWRGSRQPAQHCLVWFSTVVENSH